MSDKENNKSNVVNWDNPEDYWEPSFQLFVSDDDDDESEDEDKGKEE